VCEQPFHEVHANCVAFIHAIQLAHTNTLPIHTILNIHDNSSKVQ
jgi:hypothetical protein